MSTFEYIKNVATLTLDEERCSGCTMCTVVCPHNVFDFSGRKAHIARLNSCMECGACKKNCPENAIDVKAGVGCAAGIIAGILNKTDADCYCNTNSNCC